MQLPLRLAERARSMPRWLRVTLLVLWAALIFYGSAQPGSALPKGHGKLHAWIWNLCHAPEYGMLTLLLFVALARGGRAIVPDGRTFLVVLAFVLVYAGSDEFHQSFTPGREASACDVLTDCCGAWTVAATLRALEKPGARAADLAEVLLIGIPACMAAAAIATFVPPAFPEVPWL